MTTPEHWRRIRDLFDRALEQEESHRFEFVARESAGDEELRREVLELLEAHVEDDAFLEPAIAAGSAGEPRLPAGQRVGPYRLLRIVGAGGMGVVYEAERADDQYRKRVAIKLIKRGMDSDLVLRRFQRERQILAALEHPNIARLLDGGASHDGRPYLVMEYVEGEPIDEYCEARKLPLSRRIELFCDVCAAVHFAHQNLVIHRDLKPSNVLVTGEGQVKLLDFGVAKLLHDPEATLALTVLGGQLLTPAYASPEQIRGGAVTTATDVYSLGVILYELLAAQRPYRLESESFEEIVRIVCSEEPTRPSAAVAGDTVLSASHQQARTLRRRLAGELDNIVLMAIRKEPEHRYSSAAALAADLRRHLAGLPVMAQGDSTIYRIRKFIQRNRSAVIAAALVAATLLAGSVATFWQARRAEAERAVAQHRFEQVRELTNALLFEVHDAIAPLTGATAARELIVQRAFDYLVQLESRSGGDPALEREIAEGYLRLGEIQGNPAGASRGDLAGALKAYERARELAASILDRRSDDQDARLTLALAHRRLGDAEAWIGSVEDAVAYMREALALFADLADRRPDDERAALERVIAHIKLGDHLGNPIFPNIGELDAAFEEYRRAMALLERPPLAGSSTSSVRRFVGLTWERIAAAHRFGGDYEAAREAYSRSLRIREALYAESPANVDAARDVAVTHQTLCEVDRALDRPAAALSRCRLAVDLFTRLRDADPRNQQTIVDMARVNESLARVLEADGSSAAAAEALASAASHREELFRAQPQILHNHQNLVANYFRLGLLHLAAGDGAVAPAGSAFRRGSELLALLPEDAQPGEDVLALRAELAGRLPR